MLHGEYIDYLKSENKTNYEKCQSYYIQRKLKRFIQIDRTILTETTEFSIVHTEEEFCQKSQEQSTGH